MKEKIGKSVLFLLGLITLQQSIALSNERVAQIAQQSDIIERNNIDPAALFYMESDLALLAEKKVRKSIAGRSEDQNLFH